MLNKKQVVPLRAKSAPAHTAPWRPMLASATTLALVAGADLVTGWSLSLLPLYLVPVGIATWHLGRWAGVLTSCAIAPICVAIDLAGPFGAAASIWNAAMGLAVVLSFVVLIERLRGARAIPTQRARPGRALTVGLTATSLLLALAGVLFAWGLVADQPPLVSGEASGGSFTVGGKQESRAAALADGTLGELVNLYQDCLQQSRPLLLGSRDPRSASCLTPIQTGSIVDKLPMYHADIDGGVGTRLILVLANSRNDCRRPSDELASFQQRLRRHLENQRATNERARAAANKLADRSRVLVTSLEQSKSLPSDLASLLLFDADDRLGHCLYQFDKAIGKHDLRAARIWSAELASAAFALSDLHAWLAFLFDNYLAALDFQRHCSPLFDAADRQPANYGPATTSYLPGGLLILHGDANFLEVERRAEQMFALPIEERAALADDAARTQGSLWISPAQRTAFLRLESSLAPANRRLLNLAARARYETTYLNAMLDRAQRSDTLDQLVQAARRFDAAHPSATVSQLMEVLMYRGHSFAGLEWGDRYHAALVDEASRLDKSELAAFEQACLRTSNFFRQSTYGRTFTLRESLEKKCLDCIRATDMIAALYRDAGHPNVGHVRWSCEVFGHSVAAYLGTENGQPTVLLGDAMDLPSQLERWPDAYFRGHRWPTGFENNPPPYCAELYVRGLDNYVWAEGYIIRGPQAGTLYSAAIPYLPGRGEAGSRKVFDGPYPQ